MNEASRVQAVLDRVVYKHWTFEVLLSAGHGVAIRCLFMAPCVLKPMLKDEPQYGRAWLVTGMTEDAIITTAFCAIKLAEEHEVLENFLVDGVRVFNPHTPIAKLIATQRQT